MKKLPSDPNEDPLPLDDSSDQLCDLLGNARHCKAAPNFVQNVVREARLSADQARGSAASRWFAGLVESFQRPVFALSATATAAVAVAVLVLLSQSGDDGATNLSGVAQAPPMAVDPVNVSTPPQTPVSYTVADELDDIDYLGELVAVTDPGALNDQMLADLLY